MPESAGAGLSIEKMIDTAERSTNGESYQIIMRGENYKLGVIITIQADRSPHFSIELLLRIFVSFSSVDPPLLEKATGIFNLLTERGYLVAYEDAGWFCCRRSMESGELIRECELIHKILEGYYGDKGG